MADTLLVKLLQPFHASLLSDPGLTCILALYQTKVRYFRSGGSIYYIMKKIFVCGFMCIHNSDIFTDTWLYLYFIVDFYPT